MKKILCIIFIPLFVNANGNQGIQFEQTLSWSQIKAKAKAENKFIFIDAYASWCGPCKRMDKEIYPNDTVGNYMNDKFISVKVQMDSTAKDNEQIRKWYADAHDIYEKYQVHAFPSFLFFTPNGQLIYRDMGFKNSADFIALAQKAFDPDNALYFSQLAAYKEGERDYATLGKLADFVSRVTGDTKLAQQMAGEYIDHADKKQLLTRDNILMVLFDARNGKLADSLAGVYIPTVFDKLTRDEIANKENLDFIGRYNKYVHSTDNVFQLCYTSPKEVDKIMGMNGWANGYIIYPVIEREELDSRLWAENKPVFKQPDWKKMAEAIQKKYPKLDVRALMLDYQTGYYSYLKDWREWTRYQDQKINELIKADAFKKNEAWDYAELNLTAWQLFLCTNDKGILRTALKWIDLYIKTGIPNPNCLDTRAALLYKLGQKIEAIAQEEKAIELTRELAAKSGKSVADINGFQKTLNEMKEDKPIYLDQGAVWDSQAPDEKNK